MPSWDKIKNLHEAHEQISLWKEAGYKTVFTNGCFDILHLGHVDYLEKASFLGDKLILGLNADASIQRLKGKDRPINPQEARARILAALEFIDMIVLFDEDTPIHLIKNLQPSFLVKGSDYSAVETNPSSPHYIVGSDIVRNYGGEVATIDLVDGYSTTAIIKKINS